MSSYRSTRGRRRGAGADGRPESNDAVAGQRQPQSPRQQDSAGDLTGTGTANPAPRCEHLDLIVEIQGLDDGARGPTGTIEVYQPDKSVVASRLSAYAFAIPGLEALSPSPPEAKLKALKTLQLAGIRDSAQRQAFYAQHEVDVPDAKARCCSLDGALELIRGFWRGKKHPGHPVPCRAMHATDEHIWVVRAARSTDRQYHTYKIHSTCKSAREHNKTASNTHLLRGSAVVVRSGRQEDRAPYESFSALNCTNHWA